MYAKIYEQIYDSSIADNWITRTVFQDLLVLSDKDGMVDRTHEAIAARTRIPIEIVNKAIAELEQPDKRSRTKNLEGRRIVRIDPDREWGWHIVNYEYYRDLKSEFDRKAYMRKYMRDRYEPIEVRSKTNLKPQVKNLKLTVAVGTASGTQNKGVIGGAEQIYEAYPRKVARPEGLKAIDKAIKKSSFDILMTATKNFAEAWAGAPREELRYCPHPATWFNQERYNDEPSTWRNPKEHGNQERKQTDHSKGW